MRGHHHRRPPIHGGLEGAQLAKVHPRPVGGHGRQRHVRILAGVPVAGKVLHDGDRSRREDPFHRGPPAGGHLGDGAAEAPDSDHRIRRVRVDIEDRGEGQVDPERQEAARGALREILD